MKKIPISNLNAQNKTIRECEKPIFLNEANEVSLESTH